MNSASEIFQIHPSLLFWQAYDPTVKCELSSTAYRSSSGLVLVDPIRLTPFAQNQLESYGRPVAVILTNANHERASGYYRTTYQIPVIAAPEARPGISFLPEVILQYEEKIYGLLPFLIAGSVEGETGFLSPEGILFLGDCLINLHRGLEILPDRYCLNPSQLRDSLFSLVNRDFSIVTFAHGAPLTDQARTKLQQLLGFTTP